MADYKLTGLLRIALEDWQGELLHGPWDDLIDLLAGIIDRGELSLADAARLQHLLGRTRGDEPETPCPACKCPAPGMTHCLAEGLPPAVPGACPDPRLHRVSFDGKCRYCREPYYPKDWEAPSEDAVH